MRLEVWLPAMSQGWGDSSHHSCISVIFAQVTPEQWHSGTRTLWGTCGALVGMPVGCCPQPSCASTQSPAESPGICPQPPHGSATSPADSYLQQGGWQLDGPRHGCCSQDHCHRGCWCRLACPWLSWGPALAQGKTLSPPVPAGYLSPAPCLGKLSVPWKQHGEVEREMLIPPCQDPPKMELPRGVLPPKVKTWE